MKTRSFDHLSPGEADMPACPDEQLVLEALDDSNLAFEQLIKQYQYRVLRTIASIIGDEQAAKDVAQETFLSAWSGLAKLREREKFGRWLNRIAINLSKDWLRDQRRHHGNEVPLDENAVVLTQEVRYQRDKLRQTIWEAIDELTEHYREAVILYYISGYSYKEMSKMLSVPVSTVQGRLQQARNQLRKEFLDMVTKLQLEIDSTVHKFLKEHAKKDGVSVEGLIIRLIERYRRDINTSRVITRQVEEATLDYGSVSPDGRYISYVNWDKGNLAIHDFETGESRDLTDEGTWEGDWQFVDSSECTTWSPDSKQIAYVWYNGADASLRIVGIDGSKPRVLLSRPSVSGLPWPWAWSPDGKHILASHGDKAKTEEIEIIVLVSVADGSIHPLKSLGPGHSLIPGPCKESKLPGFRDRASWMPTMRLSPDGRYVVYDSIQSEDSLERDIFLFAADGDHEVTLVEHPADDFTPFWTPDGNRIVFVSDRSGSMGIWVLEVVDGKPKGSPQLISDDLNGMYPLGLTQDGSYYYSLPGRENDIYFAELDPETGKVVKPPYKAVQTFEGLNGRPDFSPDGKHLAYISRRPWGRPFIIRSLETGEEHEIQTDIPLGLGRYSAPRCSPDGRSILVLATATNSAKQTSWGLHQIHIETGAVTHIVWQNETGRIAGLAPPVWSLDGSKIFFVRRRGGGNSISSNISVYDLKAVREWSPDFRSKHGKDCYKHDLALSPDGQQLAFVECFKDRHSIEIAPTVGGDTREVARLPKEGFPNGMGLVWTPDGRHLLFAESKDDVTELRRVSVEGGDPESLGLTMKKIQNLRIHPDGRRIAFTGPGSGRGPELWVMENILPKSTASR